jgi:threonine/homoserine/homoserine lactone efflux protein
MVTALLVGLVVGFVMVMPPGPIAMACMRQALARQAREDVALVLGVAVMDSGYALLAACASSALFGTLWGMLMHHAWALLAFQGGVSRCWWGLACTIAGPACPQPEAGQETGSSLVAKTTHHELRRWPPSGVEHLAVWGSSTGFFAQPPKKVYSRN